MTADPVNPSAPLTFG